jgi:hypothetical protein
MAVINNPTEVLHRIRAKLYPNYLPGVSGEYIARTDDEASLDIEQVCAALKNRGGSTAQYDDLVEHVRQFFNEAAYQLCDGFSVNTGYFSVHPRIGGTFSAASEGHTEHGHPINFSFRTRQPLRDLTKYIEVFIEGVAAVQGFIDEVIDVDPGAVNETLTPGGQFVVTGHKIKVAGTDPGVGLYFVPQGGGSPVKVTTPLAENSTSKIIGIIPALGAGGYTVEVRTQFSSGSTLLKEVRVVRFETVLTVGAAPAPSGGKGGSG